MKVAVRTLISSFNNFNLGAIFLNRSGLNLKCWIELTSSSPSLHIPGGEGSSARLIVIPGTMTKRTRSN